MFTGIIEAQGVIVSVKRNDTNTTFIIESEISAQLMPDQSLSHDGVCLTIEGVAHNRHQVTAVAETLSKTSLANWTPGYKVNIERSLSTNGRLDGHFVQGHIDATGKCLNIINKSGSWEFTFTFPDRFASLIIEKGSIAVNGISLTAYMVSRNSFNVAIIPYTWVHTNLSALNEGDVVNIEFDMLGKYLNRILSLKTENAL